MDINLETNLEPKEISDEIKQEHPFIKKEDLDQYRNV